MNKLHPQVSRTLNLDMQILGKKIEAKFEVPVQLYFHKQTRTNKLSKQT